MRRLSTILAFLVVIAGATALWLRSNQSGVDMEARQPVEPRSTPDSSKQTASPISTTASPGTAVNPDRALSQSTDRTPAFQIYAATSARELLNAAAKLPSNSLDGWRELQSASQHCGFLADGRTPEQAYAHLEALGVAKRGDAAQQNYVTQRKMLATFCSGAGAEDFARALERLRGAGNTQTNSTNANDTVRRYLDSLIDAPEETLAESSTQETLWRIASETDSPEIFRRALDFAAVSGAAPDFTEFDQSLPDGVNALRRVELRRLAVEYAACTWTRGCGPGSLQVISSCTYFGRCASNLSWSETVRGIYTDREVESVEALGQRLLQRTRPTGP
jgi:hypothetical protein